MTARADAAALRVTGLSKTYAGSDTPAVDRLDLRLAPGSFTALLGSSGCGKSTTLRLIAGLLEPSAGDVVLDGRSLLGRPAERRAISLVFQRPTLFPHLDVAGNVGFGLRMGRTPRAETRRRVGEMLERVHLGALAHRRPDQLSGGQEQRVALARALVTAPRLLLLDEPFSSLDAALRVEMRSLVRELAEQSPVTTLLVTHDQREAVGLADRITLLAQGRLIGEGAPESFFSRPPSLAAARFFGLVELTGRVCGGVFRACGGGPRVECGPDTPDGPGVLVWRPEVTMLDPAPAESREAVTVEAVCFAGAHQELRLAWGSARLSVHVPVTAAYAVGQRLTVHLPIDRLAVFGTAAPSPPSTPKDR